MSDLSRYEADRTSRLARAAAVRGASGKLCPAERATQLLEAIIEPAEAAGLNLVHIWSDPREWFSVALFRRG